MAMASFLLLWCCVFLLEPHIPGPIFINLLQLKKDRKGQLRSKRVVFSECTLRKNDHLLPTVTCKNNQEPQLSGDLSSFPLTSHTVAELKCWHNVILLCSRLKVIYKRWESLSFHHFLIDQKRQQMTIGRDIRQYFKVKEHLIIC